MSEDDFKGTVSLLLVSNERAAATDGKVICPPFFSRQMLRDFWGFLSYIFSELKKSMN